MADLKISELASVADIQASDELVLARVGATKKVAGSVLATQAELDAHTAATYDYERIWFEAEGWKGWTYPPNLSTVNLTLVTQRVIYVLLSLRAGDTVSKLIFWVGATAATVTTIKAGLYSTASARLAVSANSPTKLDAFGPAGIDMTTPYVVPTTGLYYAAILVVATTPGALHSASALTGKGNTGEQTVNIMAMLQNSQTDLPDPAVMTATTQPFWVGWA